MDTFIGPNADKIKMQIYNNKFTNIGLHTQKCANVTCVVVVITSDYLLSIYPYQIYTNYLLWLLAFVYDDRVSNVAVAHRF